jgi:hypothetical protein
MSWTAPKGILNKIVVNESNPKDCTINGPKVEIPPLGILGPGVSTLFSSCVTGSPTHEIENIKENQNHVFRSKKLSLT